MSKFCFSSKRCPGLIVSGTIERYSNSEFGSGRNLVEVEIESIHCGIVNVYEYLSIDVLDKLFEEAQDQDYEPAERCDFDYLLTTYSDLK